MIPTDYLPVVDRVVAMRKDHPDWSLSTAILVDDGTRVLMRATITGPDDVIVATAYAEETRGAARYAPPIETCETSAVGRALRFAGYPDKAGLTSEEEQRSQNVSAGVEAVQPRTPPRRTPRPVGEPTPAETTTSTTPRKDAMLKRMHTLMTEAGITGRDERLRFAEHVTGRNLESSKDLTMGEIANIINAIPRPEEAS